MTSDERKRPSQLALIRQSETLADDLRFFEADLAEAFEAGKREMAAELSLLIDCGECGARATCITKAPLGYRKEPSCDKHCNHTTRWAEGCVLLSTLAQKERTDGD